MYPNSKLKFYDFDRKKTENSSGTNYAALNFFTRVVNTFWMTSSYIYYNKYSDILFEGDHVKIFGVVEYNRFSETWEFSKPLALLKQDVADYINDLWWSKLSCGSGIFFRGIFAALFLWGTFAFGKGLLNSIRQGLRSLWRHGFA